MAKPLASHPSLVKIMAEAMLEEDYKLSHSNLQEWAEEEAKKTEQDATANDNASSMTPEATEERDDNIARDDDSPSKKHERSVVIQVPPKRQKLCTAYSPKEVVEGKSYRNGSILWMMFVQYIPYSQIESWLVLNRTYDSSPHQCLCRRQTKCNQNGNMLL